MSELGPVVQKTLYKHRKDGRTAAARGYLPNLDLGDYVFFARSNFFAMEKLALSWCGPSSIVSTVSEYVYTIKVRRNGTHEDVRISRLKLFSDKEV